MPLQRRHLLSLAALAPLGALAQAQPAAPPELAGWRLQGQGQMRFFGLLIYEIRLWAEAEIGAAWARQPLALELVYARALKGEEIAKRSLVEMRRQGEIGEAEAARWLSQMQAAFPDVQAGDRISGRHLPDVGAEFFVNGRLSRRVHEPRFARLFFGIWLARESSEPGLRRQLLGAAA